MVLLFIFGWPLLAHPEAEPGLIHALLTPKFDGKTARFHRFRIRVGKMRAEVADLGFKLPVSGGLGDATLAINGGYWEWHLGKPRMIGWVVSRGTQLSPLRKKLDGGVLIVQHGRARIARSASVSQQLAGVEPAVQCRPRLVESGKVVTQLSQEGRATRTAVCIRDAGSTLDAYLSDPRDRGPTLDELGRWLAAEGCSDALNLDGGPSTAAAFRNADGVLRIGAGVGLPYAIRFAPR